MLDHSENPGSLLLLALLSCLVGTATGLVVVVFRIGLQYADQWRDSWITRAQSWLPGLLLTAGVIAGLTALAAWMVDRIAPYAAGCRVLHNPAKADPLEPSCSATERSSASLGIW
jgi:H+/Cl- antiporter ClcA